MKEVICASCATPIYMTDDNYQHRQEDGKTFYCQNGHPQVFREPEVKKLKKQVEQMGLRIKGLENLNNYYRHAVNGYKGQIAKLKKKIKALEEVNEKKAENQTGEDACEQFVV